MHIRLPMNENLRFSAGQHVEFMLKNGERRSYSIATVPTAEGASELEFHLRHMPGGLFTDHVFSSMKPRELLTFEGPLGSFSLREGGGRPMVFVATGTGFAPIMSMLTLAFKKKIHEKRPVHLYWGGRTRADLYLFDLARSWEQKYSNFSFHPVLSVPSELCNWTGRTGYVTKAVMEDHADLSAYQVYACGSPQMIRAARQEFIELGGLPDKEFMADAFLSTADRFTANQTTP